jgi:microcystin-dependent protein
MQRINTTNKATDLFGAGKHGYRAGNPATGQSATELSFDTMNAVQEEIAGVIEGASIALVPGNNTQLIAAINALIALGGFTQAAADARYSALVNRLPAGAVFSHAGTTAPTGSLIIPVAASTVSRTTYAALFAAIGTTWGVGDGATTFGLPWIPANYTDVQASANVGTSSVGEVIAHTHTTNAAAGGAWSAGSGVTNVPQYTATPSGSTGGAANLAAGVRFLKCIKY